MLVTSLGSTIFWALGASMVFVGAHAVTHKTEFHQVQAPILLRTVNGALMACDLVEQMYVGTNF
jgi:hypothetical protein